MKKPALSSQTGAVIVASLLLIAPVALAQHDGHTAAPAAASSAAPATAAPATAPQRGHEHMGGKPVADTNPSTAAYKAINEKMHKDMAIVFSGDADVDFVRGMIPHHQAAIDMARVVAGFGKDPEIRKLAAEVIKAQESEIVMMREWLAKNAK